jgi:hypothetical protein
MSREDFDLLFDMFRMKAISQARQGLAVDASSIIIYSKERLLLFILILAVSRDHKFLYLGIICVSCLLMITLYANSARMNKEQQFILGVTQLTAMELISGRIDQYSDDGGTAKPTAPRFSQSAPWITEFRFGFIYLSLFLQELKIDVGIGRSYNVDLIALRSTICLRFFGKKR